MRNLKRALSLLLAAAMLIGMMVVGASAVSYNDFPDRDEIVNKDAVSMLTTLGIIEGTDQGTYNPTGDVDRAQMAKMISVALTNNEDCDTLYQNVNSGLTDISANWARGYINYCYVRGIIAGRGDNTFDPSANVTGVEAAKMLLAALGYNAEIEGLVGPDWALNTAALAQQLGIFRNFTKDVSEPLNRDDAALLIYNALDVELIQEYRNGYAIAYDDSRTILSSVFGVIRVEGVVSANEWAQLERTDSDAALREGRTTLENVVWYDSTTANTRVEEGVVEDQPVTFNWSTSVDMIGKAVTMYVEKTTILANSTVIGVATNDDMNVIHTTAAAEDTSSDYLRGTGVSVNETTEYYVNYGYQANEAAAIETINEHANYDLDPTTDYDYFVANGIPVEVIDNDDDGIAEYVLYTLETLSEVRSYSERNEEFTLYAPGRDTKGKLDNTADSFAVDFEDAVYPNGDTIATDDLVLYVQYGGRTYITLPEIISGTMTRLDRDEDDELYITLDNGEEYYQSFIADAASKVDVELIHFDIDEPETRTSEPGFDDVFDFILDSNGYVIAIRPTEEQVTNYGLVIGSAWTQNALTKAGEIEILKADNTTATYDLDWNESRKVFTSSTIDTNAERDDALEDYLGTRDVVDYSTYTTGNAVGTVIVYSLNDDETELTIERILGLHEENVTAATADGSFIDDDGLVTEPANNSDRYVGDGNDVPAYIDRNEGAEGSIASLGGTNSTPNLQWTLSRAYDQGDASLWLDYGTTEVEYAIDLNTVAFYFTREAGDDGEVGTADDELNYGVATGWNNMGDVDLIAGEDIGVQVYPVERKTNDRTWETSRLAEVVLFNAETTITSRDYMLVLSRNAYTADDELLLNVVFEDGTAAEIEIDDEGNFDPEDPNAYMDAYAYVENADGTYDIITGTGYRIFDSDAVLLLNGTVENDNGDIYSVPSDADIWDVTDMSDAEDDISEGEFTYIESHAVIVPTEVGGHTMRTAWVWEIDSTTETPVQGATFTDYVDEDPTTGAIELYWYDEHNVAPTTRDIRELMADYLGENVERAVQISGQWFAITEDGDWWDLDLVQIRKVTYGNQTRWVRNATNDLIGHSAITFTASDDLENGDAVLMDATSTLYAGSETTDATFTGDRSSFEYTGSVAGDIELSDAYALNAAGIVKTMEDGNPVPTDTGYVAAGTVVTLESAGALAAGYYRFEVNGTAVGEYQFADSTHTITTEVTMTKATTVTLSDQAALVTYNGDNVGYYEAGDHATFTVASTSSNGAMNILRNRLIGSSIAYDLTAGHVERAGTTMDYTVNMSDIDTNGRINFYDAVVYGSFSDGTIDVDGTNGGTSGGCVATGETVTVTADAGHVVSNVTINGVDVELTDGAKGEATVSFVVPNTSNYSIVITITSAS